MSVGILLANAHRATRDGLRTILSSEGGFEIVGYAESGREAVRLAMTLAPDVVIMDMDIPDLNGVEATRQIKTQNPPVKIIALSTYADRGYVLGTLEAGASGYVLENRAYDELQRAVRAVAQGKEYLSAGIAQIATEVQSGHPSSRASCGPAELEPRERQIVQLLGEGYTLPEIARRMHISTRTAEAHRRNIMKKLDLDSVAEVTEYAAREGLTSRDR
jgi:DNA-binding NarL/FixJ family response regulator